MKPMLHRSGTRDVYFRHTKAPKPIEGLQVGDEVAYTRYFLMQTCFPATDVAWHIRGTVVSLHPNGIWAEIQWKGEESPRMVALQHLAKPGPNLRFCE